jgi:hypothetical protein
MAELVLTKEELQSEKAIITSKIAELETKAGKEAFVFAAAATVATSIATLADSQPSKSGRVSMRAFLLTAKNIIERHPEGVIEQEMQSLNAKSLAIDTELAVIDKPISEVEIEAGGKQ